MQLLCLGDIAISEGEMPVWPLPLPAQTHPGESMCLFNWELPLGDTLNARPRSSGPRLMADPRALATLAGWAPGYAALATNHILDAGTPGLASTRASLQAAGFGVVGAGSTPEEIARPLFWETREGRLAIVNWVFPETHPDWPMVPGPNGWPGSEEAGYTLRRLKTEADWVLVFVHWSDELFPYPRMDDRVVARQLAQMGADIVVGHHPHVVRGMETIGACPIFYSLGNFYFSDIPDGRGAWINKAAPRNREGLGVLATFRPGRPVTWQALSYWQVGRRVLHDSLGRAARRLAWASGPLERRQGADYAAWYAAERARFDRWGARWHFGVRRLGLLGTVEHVARGRVAPSKKGSAC